MNPKGDMHPFDNDSSWSDVAEECGWEPAILSEGARVHFDKFSQQIKCWHVGTSAIYKVVYAVFKGRFIPNEQYPYACIEKHLETLAPILIPASCITPLAFWTYWMSCDKRLKALSKRFENISEVFKYYARKLNHQADDLRTVDMEEIFGADHAHYQVANLKNLIIFRGRHAYSSHGLMMTRTHLSFLIECTVRLANLLDYAAREYSGNKPMKAAIFRMVRKTIIRAGKAKKNNADKVVQAFHKARAYSQMLLFENIMEDAMLEAVVEYQNKGLSDVLQLTEYVKILAPLPKGFWLDLLHVYKWMPPPDYDATSAFEELREFHFSTRKSALSENATEEQKELWKLIVKERKLNIAIAYKQTYDRYPAGLEIEGEHPSSEGLDGWEPVNLFPYLRYGKDVVSQIKDKATVAARICEETESNQKHPDKNFLLWYLRHKNDINTVDDAQALYDNQLPEDNYSRVAYKGEAHKPGSRLFFMAPPRARILLGELEGNISKIASVYPASLQSVSSTVKDVRLEALFDTFAQPGDDDCEGPLTCLIVTFDLSKFSPRFNPEVLQDLHVFWAKVFAYQPIEAMGKLGSRSTILHTSNKLVMQYDNQGADLEGFRGRMMTLFHADLLSAACRLATQRGYIAGRAFSAVFIDDGAVRVFARGEGDEAYKNARDFLGCMQEIYDAAGQENHPNKTIVSFIGGELLSEQFLWGQKLKCAIKASIRLYPKYEQPVSTLADEFAALFSTSQGACKEGANWVVAYRRLAEAELKAMYRWARKEFMKQDPVDLCLKMITPKAAGGFGFPPLQAITTTCVNELTIEGFGILNKAARRIPLYKDKIEAIVGRPVMLRDPLSILRDPLRIRYACPVIVENRLVDAIVKKLCELPGPWGEFIEAYTSEELRGHATDIAEALMKLDTISVPVFTRIWDTTPLNYMESIVMKFKKADSVQFVLKRHEVTVIRKKNRDDVTNVLRYNFTAQS